MWDRVDDLRGYRVPAPPPPERFPLRMSGTARLSIVLGLGAIVLSIAILLLTGRIFLLFFVAFGPGLYYLLSGAPRSLDVHHDSIVIRSWLRAPRRLPSAELAVERHPEGLVLTTSEGTLEISADHFEDEDALERCARALRAVAASYRST